MIIIDKVDALVFVEVLQNVQIGEIFRDHLNDKLTVGSEGIGLVGHIFLVFRRLSHHGVVFLHHFLRIVGPVDLQRSLVFLEVDVVFDKVKQTVVDILQIGVQILVCRDVFMLVFGDFILRKTFSFNEKRQLPDKQLIQLVDAFKQTFNSIVYVGLARLDLRVERL